MVEVFCRISNEDSQVSTDYKVVCQTSAGTLNNLEQVSNIMVSWIYSNLPDRDTGFDFTYKPDPLIESIHPQLTVLR